MKGDVGGDWSLFIFWVGNGDVLVVEDNVVVMNKDCVDVI